MKFRKLPVEIEAEQVTKDNLSAVEAFIKDVEGVQRVYVHNDENSTWTLESSLEEYTRLGFEIPTLEGVMLAVDGDWIIKGVQGEFYPCKPDIFQATYEPVV